MLAKDAKELRFFTNVQQRWRWEGIVQLARLPDRIHLLCWMRSNADPLWGWQGIKGSQEGGKTMMVLQAIWFERRWGKQTREIMKTKIVGSVWPQDSFAALTVGRWSPRWTIHFIPTMRNNEKIKSARHNRYIYIYIFFFNLVGILFSFYFSGIAEHGKSWAWHSGDNNWLVLGKTNKWVRDSSFFSFQQRAWIFCTIARQIKLHLWSL